MAGRTLPPYSLTEILEQSMVCIAKSHPKRGADDLRGYKAADSSHDEKRREGHRGLGLALADGVARDELLTGCGGR